MTAHRPKTAKAKKMEVEPVVAADLAERIAMNVHGCALVDVKPQVAGTAIATVCEYLAAFAAPLLVTPNPKMNARAFVDVSPMQHQQATGKAELQSSDRFVRGQSLTENVRESMLAWCYSRNLLTARQFDAGKRLYADYVKSGREIPGVPPMDQDKVDKSGQRGATDAMLEAASRFERSMKQCQHDDMRKAVFCMVVLDENADAVAKQIKVHPKAVMPIVRMGLDLVARSYDGYHGERSF